MILKRIGPVSAAKLSGSLHLLLGLVVGSIVALVSVLGLAILPRTDSAIPFAGYLFGVGAVIAFPVFYGILGFITGWIMAALYNLAARFVGGLQLDLK